MFDFIVKFYRRNKQNKFKHFLLRISSAVIYVIVFSRVVDYVINDLIFKKPRPNLPIDEGSTKFIYYIFAKEGFAISIFVILVLFLIDLFSYKKNKSIKK